MRFALWFLSLFPFVLLHGISNVLFFLLYHVFRYRRKVVLANIQRSFPNEYPEWHLAIERKFYQNFCDLMIETIKSTTLSEEEFRKRCTLTTPEIAKEWVRGGKHWNGISSHLANWEWLGFAMCIDTPFDCYAVYKPLSNLKMDAFIKKTRGRFGLKLISMKALRTFFTTPHDRPVLLGLLSDQAPHDYSKAFEIEFLSQKTYYVPGPGLLVVQHGMKPCWGWMRRVGRSRFEWGLEEIVPDLSVPLQDSEREQIARVAKAYALSGSDSERAYRIVKEYSRLLEAKIKMAPEDWLWSHRRWKSR